MLSTAWASPSECAAASPPENSKVAAASNGSPSTTITISTLWSTASSSFGINRMYAQVQVEIATEGTTTVTDDGDDVATDGVVEESGG